MAYVVLLIVALTAGPFVYAVWLLRSAGNELAHRRELLAGLEVLRVTARTSYESVQSAHDSALGALSGTVEAWYGLRETRAVGSTLEERFPRIEARAARDPEFMDALEDAVVVLDETWPAGFTSIDDVLNRTARVDGLNLRLRQLVYAYDASERPGLGRLFHRRRRTS